MSVLRYIFLYLIVGLTIVNGLTSLYSSFQQKNTASAYPLHRLAESFVPLTPVFANQRDAGYLTDKNINETPVIARYELAQFTLAPTRLLLNNANFPLVLIDASDPTHALALIKEHNLTPVKADNTGLILAVNKRFTQQP